MNTASEIKLHQSAHPVSRIASGLCESLRNIRKHRLLMQEEINHVLGGLMFDTNSRTMPATPAETPKEK